MSDPRIDTVTEVLREAGVQTNLDDTDTLATKIVNALDREYGAGTAPAPTSDTLAAAPTPNPETPAATPWG